MEHNNNIEDDLEKIAPNLFKIKKENPFEVPKDYFDTLPTIIQEQCLQSTKNKTFSWLHIFYKPAYSIAFVLLLVGIGYVVNTTEPSVTSNYAFSSDSLEIESFDESLIIDELASISNKNNNEVEDYLIDDNIESSQLESEL